MYGEAQVRSVPTAAPAHAGTNLYLALLVNDGRWEPKAKVRSSATAPTWPTPARPEPPSTSGRQTSELLRQASRKCALISHVSFAQRKPLKSLGSESRAKIMSSAHAPEA